mgnify:CR=1 FL=1
MCGIFGFVTLDPTPISASIGSTVFKIAKASVRRGQDASGLLVYDEDYSIIKTNAKITQILPKSKVRDYLVSEP